MLWSQFKNQPTLHSRQYKTYRAWTFIVVHAVFCNMSITRMYICHTILPTKSSNEKLLSKRKFLLWFHVLGDGQIQWTVDAQPEESYCVPKETKPSINTNVHKYALQNSWNELKTFSLFKLFFTSLGQKKNKKLTSCMIFFIFFCFALASNCVCVHYMNLC